MPIELFVFPRSPRAFKVMAVANQLRLDWVPRYLNAAKGEHKAPQYAALNPNMRMPTLREGDFVLWESDAIAQYLAAKKPESGLLPLDERARADVTRWQCWNLAHWDPACVAFAYEYVAKPAVLGINEPDQAALARGAELFHRAAKVLDAHLAGKTCIIGDGPTLADFFIGSSMTLAEMAHYPLEPYGEIRRWYEGLSALPAWQKTLAFVAAPPASAV
jgi:glutathione S-transferase